MTVDRRVHGPAQRVGMALHQRVVALVDGALLEGTLEPGVRQLGLATTIRPLVPTSRRCTTPWRSAAPLVAMR